VFYTSVRKNFGKARFATRRIRWFELVARHINFSSYSGIFLGFCMFLRLHNYAFQLRNSCTVESKDDSKGKYVPMNA
jgi:hypothetical protein